MLKKYLLRGLGILALCSLISVLFFPNEIAEAAKSLYGSYVIQGNLNVGGDTTITGTTTLNGSVVLSGSTGAIDSTSTIHADGAIDSDSTITSDTTVQGADLYATDDISCDDDLTVTGTCGCGTVTGDGTGLTGMPEDGKTYQTDGADDITAGKVLCMNSTQQVKLADSRSSCALNIVGISAAADIDLSNTVLVYDLPGQKITVAGTSANTLYYASKTPGALVSSASLPAERLNSFAKKIRVGRTDNDNNLILDIEAEDEYSQHLILSADLTSKTTADVGDQLNFTRTTTASYWDRGLLKYASKREPRFETNSAGTALGALLETARTNYATYSRDLSNVAWVKTTMTATLDQTGIDGIANTASLVTATGANATILQDIPAFDTAVLGIFSCYVKRSVGTGTVSITMDTGSTYLDVTALINNSTFTRVSTVALAIGAENGDVGFKLGTSADAIIVDHCQAEIPDDVDALASSPIWTFASTVARNADDLTYRVPSHGSEYMIVIDARMDQKSPSANPVPIIGTSQAANLLLACTGTTNFNLHARYDADGSTISAANGSCSLGTYKTYFASFSMVNINMHLENLTDDAGTDDAWNGPATLGGAFTWGDSILIGDSAGYVNANLHVKNLRIYNFYTTTAAELAFLEE